MTMSARLWVGRERQRLCSALTAGDLDALTATHAEDKSQMVTLCVSMGRCE
jgi:hypothetical protein